MPATTNGRRATAMVARTKSIPRRLAGALVFASIVSLGCRDTTEPADNCSAIQDIELDEPVNGSLNTGDCLLSQDGSFVDYWRLVLTSETTLQIDLTSTQFNAYLLLITPSGTDLGQADAGGDGEDARITITRSAGTYHILANSSDPGETGAYQLTVSVVPPG